MSDDERELHRLLADGDGPGIVARALRATELAKRVTAQPTRAQVMRPASREGVSTARTASASLRGA